MYVIRLTSSRLFDSNNTRSCKSMIMTITIPTTISTHETFCSEMNLCVRFHLLYYYFIQTIIIYCLEYHIYLMEEDSDFHDFYLY